MADTDNVAQTGILYYRAKWVEGPQLTAPWKVDQLSYQGKPYSSMGNAGSSPAGAK